MTPMRRDGVFCQRFSLVEHAVLPVVSTATPIQHRDARKCGKGRASITSDSDDDKSDRQPASSFRVLCSSLILPRLPLSAPRVRCRRRPWTRPMTTARPCPLCWHTSTRTRSLATGRARRASTGCTRWVNVDEQFCLLDSRLLIVYMLYSDDIFHVFRNGQMTHRPPCEFHSEAPAYPVSFIRKQRPTGPTVQRMAIGLVGACNFPFSFCVLRSVAATLNTREGPRTCGASNPEQLTCNSPEVTSLCTLA